MEISLNNNTNKMEKLYPPSICATPNQNSCAFLWTLLFLCRYANEINKNIRYLNGPNAFS